MQGHAVAPDGGPTLDDHERTAGDGRQRRQGLGGGDGRGDGDGVDDARHDDLSLFSKKVLKTFPESDLSLDRYRSARFRISHAGMISQS